MLKMRLKNMHENLRISSAAFSRPTRYPLGPPSTAMKETRFLRTGRVFYLNLALQNIIVTPLKNISMLLRTTTACTGRASSHGASGVDFSDDVESSLAL